MKNILRIMTVVILAILLPIFLTACGSGGGGGSGGDGDGGGDDSNNTPVTPLTSDIRTYKVGDSITYKMTSKDTYSGEEANGDVTFQITGEVTNPYGVKCKDYTIAGTLTGPGGSYSYRTKSLFYQDTQGNLYDCGKYDDNSASYIFITDTQYTPNGLEAGLKNPVSIGNVASGIVYYDDGSWVDCTVKIIETETATTLMGNYETYKESESCSYPDGSTFVATNWLYPSIYYIKGIAVTSDGYEFVLNMKSYNLVQ